MNVTTHDPRIPRYTGRGSIPAKALRILAAASVMACAAAYAARPARSRRAAR